MLEKQKTILQSSKDPVAVKRAALDAANSKDPADIQLLGTYLATAAFASRLDDADAYKGTYALLRLAQVINTLAANRIPATDAVLLSLIDAKEFQAHVLRMQLLIYALAVIQPAPSAAIAYWDRRSQPNGSLASDVIIALCKNESLPAMQLLEKKIAEPRHAIALKTSWLRQFVLPIRNDEPILNAFNHLIQNPALPPDLKIIIAETFFDYQPTQWYRGCDVPQPPIRSLATLPAKRIIQQIAEYALANLSLFEPLKLKVQLALKEVKTQSP